MKDIDRVVAMEWDGVEAELAPSLRKRGVDADDFRHECMDLATGILCGFAGSGAGLAGLDRAVGFLGTLPGHPDRATVVLAIIRNAIGAPNERGWPVLEAALLFPSKKRHAAKATQPGFAEHLAGP